MKFIVVLLNRLTLFFTFKPPEEQWQKNLYVLWFAQFLAMAGMSAVVPFLPTFIQELGVSDSAKAQQWSGIVFSGPFLVSFITTPIWSALGDRYSRKVIILRAVLGLSLSMIFMGNSSSVEELLLWRIFQGAASGFVAANLSFVSADTPKLRVGYALGVLQSSQAAGAVIGPFAGGVIAHATTMRFVFYTVAVLAVISALLVWKYIVEKPQNTELRQNQTATSAIVSNIRYAWNSKSIRLILLMIIISQMSVVFTTPLFPFYLRQIGTPEQWLSLATGAFVGIVGVNSLIFTPRWGKRNDSKGYKKTIRVAALIVGIATIAQALVSDVWTLLFLRFFIGIFIGGVVPSLSTALSKNTTEHLRGGIMGFASSAMLLGNLLSPPISGFISPYIGLRWCFVIAGVLMLVVSYSATKMNNTSNELGEKSEPHTNILSQEEQLPTVAAHI